MQEVLCQKCGLNSPYITCTCKNVLTYLCIDCVTSHLVYSDSVCHAFTHIDMKKGCMREQDFLQEKIILFNTKQDLLKYKGRVLHMVSDLEKFKKKVMEKVEKVMEEHAAHLLKVVTQIDQINELVDEKLYKANVKDEFYEVFERDQWHEIMDFCPMAIVLETEQVFKAIEGAVVLKYPAADSGGEDASDIEDQAIPDSESSQSSKSVSPVILPTTSDPFSLTKSQTAPSHTQSLLEPSPSPLTLSSHTQSLFEPPPSLLSSLHTLLLPSHPPLPEKSDNANSSNLPYSPVQPAPHFLTSPSVISQGLNLISLEAITPKDPSHYLYYPIPHSNMISKYDPALNSIEYLECKSSMLYPNQYSQCILPSQNLFLCGGWDFSTRLEDAFMISIEDLEVKELPPMLRARRNHSTIAYGHSVYVFGGQDGIYGISCEEFNFDIFRWTYLKDLNKVILPGPVTLSIFNGKIFIPSVGFFDPESKNYILSEMKVEPGISVCLDEMIYVISNKDRYNNVQVYRKGTEIIDRVAIDTFYCTNISPILYLNNFYFVKMSRVFEFNSKKRAITEKGFIKSF
jgi:hypothetical protein